MTFGQASAELLAGPASESRRNRVSGLCISVVSGSGGYLIGRGMDLIAPWDSLIFKLVISGNY